ncbi:MAG: hypothetical protein LWX09_12560 [Bacteroidia bacterium]|nr:hypothetical protein [Bacteroidia bacterium]
MAHTKTSKPSPQLQSETPPNREAAPATLIPDLQTTNRLSGRDEITTTHHPLPELKTMLSDAIANNLTQVREIIESLENEREVAIGVRLDVHRLSQIIRFMIENNKPIITLKCEVWYQPADNFPQKSL